MHMLKAGQHPTVAQCHYDMTASIGTEFVSHRLQVSVSARNVRNKCSTHDVWICCAFGL
jgi:hypothetical protein